MSHRCFNCGGDLTSRQETRRYGRGIDVVLVGIEVRHCDDCGEEEVVIPRIKELHNAIAADLVNRPGTLSPGEIRFLRTHMGFSSKDFAKHMGVTPETVSRWENLRNPMKLRRTADRLIRFSVQSGIQFKGYKLPASDEDTPKTDHTQRFGLGENTWEPVAAAH